MSDYPMLISNKLHSFRNFSKANLHKKSWNRGKGVVKSMVKGKTLHFLLIGKC